MAGRDYKIGLDYFELDCHLDDKFKLIEAEYGLKGFAIVIKLYQSIYSGFGYYCEWNPDISVLWAYQLGCTHSVGSNLIQGDVGNAFEEGSLSGFPKNLINEVVAASIRRNLFSKELFKKYHILTSAGVQKRYLNATSKRGKVELIKEYLLIDVGKNCKNVVINSISDGRNSIFDGRNEQRKEEKSKVNNKNTLCRDEAEALFEKLWKLYPVKKGKGQISAAKKIELLKIGSDEMGRAVERYLNYVRSIDYLHYQNGGTFFNTGYVDYLDENYESYELEGKSIANAFTNFPQRKQALGELEKQLLDIEG